MDAENPCKARCKSEREPGRMRLRLNREQTADLKAGPFEDPYFAKEVMRGIIKGRQYGNQTMVFLRPPDVARAILWRLKKRALSTKRTGEVRSTCASGTFADSGSPQQLRSRTSVKRRKQLA
jgi:hypothetical protein